MILSALYKELRAILCESDARYVLKKRFDLSHSDLISSPDRKLDVDVLALVRADIQRLNAGEPISRIYSEREFWGLDFEISEGTLDPRQDTETLIEAVLERYKDAPPSTILDLGTGSGCILISLLGEFKSARGIGVDLCFDAVSTAKKNAVRHGVGERAGFVCGSWAQSLDAKFDLIVSNPPYISNQVIPELDENVQNYDPILALDGGDDGLQAYKSIFSAIPQHAKSGTSLFLEIGFDQAEMVSRLSEESRFSVRGVSLDSAGHPRVVDSFFK